MSIPLLTPPPSGEQAIPFDELVARAEAGLPSSLPGDPTKIMVALDVDGTLLLPEGASERVISAFHDGVAAGMKMVIATGRGVNAVDPVFGYLKASQGWAVCSNGTTMGQWDPQLEGGRRVVRRHSFNPAEAIDALRQVMPDALIGSERDYGYAVSAPFPHGELIETFRVESMENLRSTPSTKVVGRAPSLTREEFSEAIAQTGLADTHEVAIGWTSWVDVGPRGFTKATGLEELAEYLQVPHSGIVTVGDGTNDIPMLQWAAHGVAMGGADEDVRSHADAVTGSVENDGAAALVRAILNRF